MKRDLSRVGWRACGAVAAALLLGGGVLAVVLLWRTEIPSHLAVVVPDPRDYFSAHQLARASSYDRVASLDALGAQLSTLVVLFLYARRGAAFVRESSAGRIGTGMLLAMLAFALSWLAQSPLQLVGLWWERKHHLASTGYPALVTSSFIALGAQFLFICVAVLIVMGLAKPLRRLWWIAAVPVFAALAVGQAFVSPYLIPGQHKLEDPRLSWQAEQYARRDQLGHVTVEVQDVHQSLAQPNAESVGLGASRRVILWDTLFRHPFTERDRALVIAHELGHLERRHIPKLIAWQALFALPLAALVALATRRRGGLYQPAAVPVAIFAFALLQFVSLPLRDAIHRHYEAEADWIALQTTHDPVGQRELMLRLAVASLSDPAPPAWEYMLLDDHPSIMQRIAIANGWSRRRGAGTTRTS